jgi:thiol:disulfide interchange protein DsbD
MCKKSSATEGEIIVTALIDKGWHTYSQKEVKDGPVPTSFSFTPSSSYELIGTASEKYGHEELDEAFGTRIYVFSEKAEFSQKIKIKGKPGSTVQFSIEYMSCNGMMCLPPKTVPLSVKIP